MMFLKLIPKRVIIYIVVTVIALIIGGFAGYTFCKRAQYKGIIKQQDKDAISVMKHQEQKDVINKKVQVHIDKLKEVPDASGCLDKPSGSDYLNELLRADSVAKSGFN